MTEFTCAHHTAEVYVRGGITFVGDLDPLSEVTWNRVRDDISTASVKLPPTECCDLLSDVRAGYHEMHIYRDGEPVWQGVITRVEYERDEVRVYAEDMMWVPKRTVLQTGYSNAYPNIGYAIDRAEWLLTQQCFNMNNDPWGMLPHVHRVSPPGAGPRTSRSVAAYEMTIWQDFDKYAEDHGLDYTVLGRDIYFWDHGTEWVTLPDLSEDFLSDSPRLVEYGNELYTRAFVSNARGYAGIAVAPNPWPQTYGYVDMLITNLDDSGDLTEKLAEAQGEVDKAEKELEDHREALATAQGEEQLAARDARNDRAKADMYKALADQQNAKVDNVQWLAGEWQRWADALQKEAAETGDKALNDDAAAAQKAAETAARDAEEKKELYERQKAVADTSALVAQYIPIPFYINFANEQAANLTQYQVDADNSRNYALSQQAAADAARDATRAQNDPTLQANADAVQAEADRQADIQRAEKLEGIAQDNIAKAEEKKARDSESEYARAHATTEAWIANVTEAEQELDWAINGRHGVPDKEDKDGLNDVIAEIQAATVVWADTAQRNLVGHSPAPLGIVVPANTTLLPGSGWTINHLIPGGQFTMTIERLCRQVTNVMMINEIRVDEAAPNGERVQLTASSLGVSP